MPCKPGGEITLVPSLREICLETIRSNLQHLVGVKALPSIFKQEILQLILKEIKSRRRCELKWAYFVSLSRSVKKFVVQSVPCKTLATKVLNIRPKRRVFATFVWVKRRGRCPRVPIGDPVLYRDKAKKT